MRRFFWGGEGEGELGGEKVKSFQIFIVQC